MRRSKSTKPELPPVKTKPKSDCDLCICFGHGAWYDYNTDPVSIKSCDVCEGAGYLVRTCSRSERCPDAFPHHCSSCGCKCLDCQRTRASKPRWSDFEALLAGCSGNGFPGKFIVWGTDPFQHGGGGVDRIAILQPHPNAGLVWHVCSVDASGRVETIPSPYYRSHGAFYDTLPNERFARESGSALADAKASAIEKMQRIMRV
jgi:hypothetical protein